MEMFDDSLCMGLVYWTKYDQIMSEDNIGLEIVKKPGKVPIASQKPYSDRTFDS